MEPLETSYGAAGAALSLLARVVAMWGMSFPRVGIVFRGEGVAFREVGMAFRRVGMAFR